MAWFAWHNSTSRKRICKNRSCHGRKPTSKQASVALGSGEARFCGQSPTLIPLPPHGFCGIVADPTGQAQPRKGSQLSCSWSLLCDGCHTRSTAPICSPNRHCSLLNLVSNFALFVPVFHLDFWLVQVRQAISTLRLRGENIACKRADDVCVL